MRLNLGCGSQVPEGWINVDYGLGARFMKIPFFRAFNNKVRLFNFNWDKNIFLHDLTKDFPWPDSSADVVYSSHTLEHFSKRDGRKFLEECNRVLHDNGIIRIIVPNLNFIVNQYLKKEIAADDFVSELGVLYGEPTSMIKKLLVPYFGFPHKCMYDSERLIEILDEIGFKSTTRLPFDSDIDDIKDLELDYRAENAVIVEGRKTTKSS